MPSILSVVVHPSRIFREGLRSILAKSQFEPACTASNAQDVPSTISGACEQVLVLTGVREDSNLSETVSATKAAFQDAHIVVVGDATKRGNVTAALELGASFVDENMATSTLVKVLELVVLREPVISIFILKQLLGHYSAAARDETLATPAVDEPQPRDARGQAQAEPTLQLSVREAAILNGLVQGAPNKSIAYQLQITEATVKVHVKAILRKIRVKNRTQAAIWAINRQAFPERLGAAGDGGSPPTQGACT